MKQALSRLFDSIWYRGNPLMWLLWPFGYVYQFAMAVRRFLYRRGILERITSQVPVIIVGNLSVGGTGKTPCIVWLAQRLRERGYTPGIVCRGYGGSASEWPQLVTADSDARAVGDESVLLARRARCPVAAGPDRIAAIDLLLSLSAVDLVLSDDGLQHYRLAPSIQIAVVDGTRGLGNGWCLPAGPLREPPRRLRDVDAIIVNGGDWGHAGVFRGTMVATGVRQTTTGTMKTLAEFKGKHVHAVAGIAHPERFFTLLEDEDLLVEPHPLADHARIRASDLSFEDGELVMITEKDEVKCRDVAHAGVWCVVAEMRFSEQDEARLVRMLFRQLGAGSGP